MAADKADKEWKEADELMRKANEHSRTTFFRWEPDWEKASTEFEQAARKYQKLGPQGLAECVTAYRGAAEAHRHLNRSGEDINSAARNLEAAALAETKIPNQNVSAAKTYKEAAELYRENGQTAKAAQTLITAANLAASEDAELATQLFTSACETWENDEEKAAQATDTFKTTIAFLIKTEQYADAMAMYDRLSKLMSLDYDSKRNFIFRNYLCVIIISLALNNIEMAFNNFQRYAEASEGWMDSEPSSLANELLIAYDEADEDRLKAALRDPSFNLLDAPVARIARTLHFSEETVRAAAERQKKEIEAEVDLT